MAPVRSFYMTVLACAVAACGSVGDAGQGKPVEQDPALAAALEEQIMVDPDLVGLSQANQVAWFGPKNGLLPTVESGDKVIAAARAEALELVGGAGAMNKVPEAGAVTTGIPSEARMSATALAAASPGVPVGCPARMHYTTLWAGRLPEAFPVYPRGAVQEAAGTDEGSCALRVVNFLTPVPPGELLDFYYTRAVAAGYSATRVRAASDEVLGGKRGRSSFVAYVRNHPSGNTEVDLVVSGT